MEKSDLVFALAGLLMGASALGEKYIVWMERRGAKKMTKRKR